MLSKSSSTELIHRISLVEPTGWVCCNLSDTEQSGQEIAPVILNSIEEMNTHFKHTHINSLKCPKIRFLQIVIEQSHQNGRDTHCRQVKLLSPKEEEPVVGDMDSDENDENENIMNQDDSQKPIHLPNCFLQPKFVTPEFTQFNTIR